MVYLFVLNKLLTSEFIRSIGCRPVWHTQGCIWLIITKCVCMHNIFCLCLSIMCKVTHIIQIPPSIRKKRELHVLTNYMLFVKENAALPCPAGQYNNIISQPLFFISYKVPKQWQGGICHWASNLLLWHWHPINENAVGNFPLLRDYGAGAITLPPWVFFAEKESYCHNIPASGCSAPRHDKQLFDLPVADYSRYFNADILAVWDSMFRKSFHALINVDCVDIL